MENQLEKQPEIEIALSIGVDRGDIIEFEELLKQVPGAVLGDNDLMPLKHSFAPGVYVREIFIPKGSVLTGKIHRHEHPNFLMKGEVIVVTEFGGREHLKAPMSMISKAGTKRAVYAMEDTVWITIHANPTNETDLLKIEEFVIAPTYQDLLPTKETILIENEVTQRNCLVLALKELGRDPSCLLNLDAQGYLLPFKKALDALKENNINIEGLFVTVNEDGIYHVNTQSGTALDCVGLDVGQTLELDDMDLVGAWVAVAAGGAAVVGAGVSYANSRSQSGAAKNAAEAQLQATRESIAAQREQANKAFDIYRNEARKSRNDLTKYNAQARADLEPLRQMGLENLRTAQGFTDPNSALANQERAAFGRTLQNNLSARGLTGSSTELSGLTDFEMQLARERRNLALNLAGAGANSIQSMSQLSSGLGQGLAGISQGVGQAGSSIFGSLGGNLGSTFSQAGANQGNLMIAQAQANAQGLAGINNAFQTGLGGILQYNQQQNAANTANAQYQQLLSTLGGGSTGLSSAPSGQTFSKSPQLAWNNPFNGTRS